VSDGVLSFLTQGQTPVPAPTGTDTSVAFPLWLQSDIYNAIGAAGNLAQTPFSQFPGPQVASPSPALTQAWNLAGTNAGAWQPNLTSAGALTQANSSLSPGQVSNMLNPFESYVTGALNQNLMQNILPQVQSQFVSAGQAASPQNAQVAGQAIYNTQQAAGQALAGAYQGALSSALQEQGLGLTSGAQMGQLGALTSQLGTQDISNLNTAGQQQTNLSQANLNAAMNNFYQQQQWPYQNLSYLSDIIRGLPVQAAGSNTQTVGTQYNVPFSPSPLQVGLGTAASASALGLRRGGRVGALKHYADGGSAEASDAPTEAPDADAIYRSVFEPQEARAMARGGALSHLRMAA
jgi:hypothetical protein